MTMYQMLGDELSRTERSIAVGYSVSDRVVRDIFVRSVKRNHRLILLHPRASEIQTRLVGLAGKTEPIDARFGSEDYESVHSQIDRALRKPVTYGPTVTRSNPSGPLANAELSAVGSHEVMGLLSRPGVFLVQNLLERLEI